MASFYLQMDARLKCRLHEAAADKKNLIIFDEA